MFTSTATSGMLEPCGAVFPHGTRYGRAAMAVFNTGRHMRFNGTDAILLLGALWVLVVLVYALARWFRRFRLQRHSSNSRQRFVRETLETSISQRSAFQLDFDNPELKKYKVTGVCVEVTDAYVQMDMNGAFATPAWAGENITAQFQISFKRKPSYFQFRARIVDVMRRGNTFTMRLTMPKHVDPGQKRSTLRITPPAERILHMRLWLLDDAAPLPNYVAEMQPTDLEMRPGAREALRLENISAGGVRLTILGEQLERPLSSLPVAPNTRIVLLLMLFTGEDTPPLALWLMGKVTLAVDNEGKSLSLGIQFLQWAAVQSAAKQLSWLPTADENGVAPLAAWAMRIHLEQSKRL